MAGDWLKMEAATPDKPEVLAIAARMGWDDPDLAVGKLFRVWRWFDQHTTDGNAPGVTSALLDRIAGVSGFAEAMSFAGWLVITNDGLTLPNFSKHCGKTAKERAQTARRVALHKDSQGANAKVTHTPLPEALPREEKRRSTPEAIASGSACAPKAKRGTVLPDDFEPNDTAHSLAASLGLSVAEELPKFRDYHTHKGTTGKDWQAGFRTWLTKASEFRGRLPRGSPMQSRDAARAIASATRLEDFVNDQTTFTRLLG